MEIFVLVARNRIHPDVAVHNPPKSCISILLLRLDTLPSGSDAARFGINKENLGGWSANRCDKCPYCHGSRGNLCHSTTTLFSDRLVPLECRSQPPNGAHPGRPQIASQFVPDRWCRRRAVFLSVAS